MQWYVTASLACCGATLVAVIGLLALSSFYVYDNKKNIPSDTTDTWMTHVTALVPLTVVFALSAAGAGWVILNRNRKWFFLGLLIWNFLCFGTCVYFNVAFQLQLDKPKLKADSLFEKTQAEIVKELAKEVNGNSSSRVHGDGMFVPVWLDSIQNKSKECCGIRAFRDWEEFWPARENEVPKSCCKEPSNSEKCLTNLITIPFPGVPAMFIKTDIGCIDEINAHLRKNIRDCFIYLIILCVLFGLTEIAYLVQFCLDYGSKADDVLDTIGGGDFAQEQPLATESGNKFLNFFKKKRNVKPDVEDGPTSATPDGGDLYGVASGSLTDNGSAYTASQGTLPDSGSQDPFYNNKGNLYPDNQPPSTDLASAGSSGSDTEIDASSPLGATASEIKKKKKKKHKKKQQDDMVGSDGADGKVNRQEVFVVPDKPADVPKVKPTSSNNDYDANQSNDLPQNGYDSANPSGSGGSPPLASPSASQDEVGDKLAPGVKSASKKDKLIGFLTHKKK